MKRYDVCTLGNALLDIEIEVSDETLNRINAEKGLMTLIDAERERYILEELDGIKHLKACGGSAANSCVLIRQLGGHSFLSCKVASDEAGDYYFQDLLQKGVETNLQTQTREPGITGKCIAMITPDAERTMNTFLGITEHFGEKQINSEAIESAKFLYIEGYLVASPTAFQACLYAAHTAKKAGTKIALTLSDPNMCLHFKTQLQQLIDIGVDLLFCNQDEALIFTGSETIDDAQAHLKTLAKHYVITLSESGSIVFNGQQTYKIAAYQTIPIDTTGAGDVYAGAFLYAICYGYPFEQAGDIASLAASKVVTHYGPRLGNDEVNNIKQHMKKYQRVTNG